MTHSDWRGIVREARRPLARAPVSDWRAAVAEFRRARRQELAAGRARRGWWRRLFGLAAVPLLP